MSTESSSHFLIVDCHVHSYPSREVGLASQGGKSMSGYDGGITELLGIMKECRHIQSGYAEHDAGWSNARS